MFDLQPPLGWDDTYKDSPEKQERFFLMATGSSGIKTYSEDSEIQFNNVLDNITLVYVIQQEVAKAIAVKKEMGMHSSEFLDSSQAESSESSE